MGVKQAGNFPFPWGTIVYGDWQGLSVFHQTLYEHTARHVKLHLLH